MDMAAKLKVAQATYEKYERGERSVPARVMRMTRELQLTGTAGDEPARATQVANELPVEPQGKGAAVPERAPLPFWQAMRTEARQLRELSYSSSGRAMIAFRNGLFVAATFYVVLQHLALSFGQALFFEEDGIDYVFLGSYFIIWTLFIPLIQEIPIFKTASRLATRSLR